MSKQYSVLISEDGWPLAKIARQTTSHVYYRRPSSDYSEYETGMNGWRLGKISNRSIDIKNSYYLNDCFYLMLKKRVRI